MRGVRLRGCKTRVARLCRVFTYLEEAYAVGRVKSMRGLDDGEPEENDGIMVRERDEAVPVSIRVRRWTAGKRTRDEARNRERRRKREERKRERERKREIHTVAGGEENGQERGCRVRG